MPVLLLCLLCIAGGIYTLHMFAGPVWNAELRHLFGLDAIVTIAVSVMIAATCWLAPWNKRIDTTQASTVSPPERADTL